LSQKDLAQLPHVDVKVVDRNGKQLTYGGVPLNVLLKNAGVEIGQQKMRGEALSLCLLVLASDGYKATFALPELDDDFGIRSIILADHLDGQLLDPKEGPLRVIVPQDLRPGRWVRKVVSLQVKRVGD